MTQPNPPSRHHFIPEFMIREWAGPDGLVERFVRVHDGSVHVRRVAPSAIGFAKNLYRNDHAEDPWKAQALETDFFSPLDNVAATAMQAMLRGETNIGSELRSAWVNFLMSLFHRGPTDLDATKTAIAEMLAQEDPEIEEQYRLKRNPDQPETFVDYMKIVDPSFADRVSSHMIPGLVLNENLGEFLVNCRWQIHDVSRARVNLLLSDMPILFTPLKQPRGHLGLAIGPNKIFVASADQNFLRDLAETPHTMLVKEANKLVVGRARHFVVATNRSQQPFIVKHHGMQPIGSLAFGFER